MQEKLTFQISKAAELTPHDRQALIDLCTAAYEEAFDHLFDSLPDSTHIIARLENEIVSHAAWVTRWLQPEGVPELRTAYIEAVATLPRYQGQGFGSAVMRKLVPLINDYELGALSPSYSAFYARLGWELWQGPLFIRTAEGLVASPADEEVMIMRLPQTPALDLRAALSAEWRAGELW